MLINFVLGIAASLCAAVLIIVFGSFFSRYTRWLLTAVLGRMLDVDIESVFRTKVEAEEDIRRELDKATFIYLLTGRGNELQRGAFLNALERKPKGKLSQFRIMLPSTKPSVRRPDWTAQREEEMARIDPAYGKGILRRQIQTTVDFLSNHITNKDVELRFFDFPHIGRILLTDRAAYFTPYSRYSHGRDSCIIKHRRGGEMYDVLLRLFDQLWSVSSGPASAGDPPVQA